MPICTVDVILFNPDVTKVLMLRRKNEPLRGEWFSLGGRLLKGEKIRDCALRQARIEAGLNLDPCKLFFGGAFDEFFDRSRFGTNISLHDVNICWGYLLAEDAIVSLDPQHDAHDWKSVCASFHQAFRHKLDVLLPVAKSTKERGTAVVGTAPRS
jgi:colanic acid biosynthesis protein WcaH